MEVKIGDSYHVPKYSGSKRRLVEISDSFHYVPILQSLSVLLQDASVLEQIDCLPERVHTDGTSEDFCDGELFRSHPILSQDSRALQVIAFYDELELCNPLGTHVKTHKLGIVLFTLGNFHPRFRSSLRVINLVIAATVPIIEKYGMDEILKPFIRDIKELESSGISVLCQGRSRKFYGCFSCRQPCLAMHWVDLKNLFHLQCVSAVLVMQPMNPIEHVLIQIVLILGVNHNMKHNVSSYMGHYNHTILSVMALIAAVV